MTGDSISYWQHTAPTIPLSTDLPRSVDVVVIGGGLMGTAASYWLARAGVFVAFLPRLFPALAPLQVIRRWAGLLDYTTDHHPIVDSVPTMPQVFVVCGFSGHGMPFGLRFGQLLTEAVMSGTLPSALKPYRLDRPTLKPWKQV